MVVSNERSLIRRTFTVLDAFNETDTELGLAELTRRTGLPKSTVHRIALDLVRIGMLERSGRGFHLGLRLYELGTLVPTQRRLRDVAVPYMEDLYEVSKEVVHLGVLSGRDVLYLIKLAGHNQVPLPTRDGCRMPAHCSALGKVLVAFSPRSTAIHLIQGGLPPLTRYSIAAPNLFLEELATVARTGIAYDHQESVLGATCVAAPIFGPGRQAHAALSVTGPIARYDPTRMAHAVRVIASLISRELAAEEPNETAQMAST